MLSEFIPTFTLRRTNLAWFLGAGASASGGIPTAGDMIWDFKRKIYCVEQRVHVDRFRDLSDPDVRRELQGYFSNREEFPAEGTEDEYASYFEYFLPNEADRRRYVEEMVLRGIPSYGHHVLAALIKLGHTRVVWTTNFDRLIEDAVINAFGRTGALVIADVERAAFFMEALNEDRMPILGKLHGDFQSRRLRNTREELARQDAELRRALVETCGRFGLCVAGYSGRDNSVMDALFEGLGDGHGFPHGLFWFKPAESKVFPRVGELITSARSKGIQAEIIEAETFDELMGDLLVLEDKIPGEIRVPLSAHRPRVSDAPSKPTAGHWPVVRLSAARVLSWPTAARLVDCQIGGVEEVQSAISETNASVVATRKKQGVLAFGSDSELRRAFGRFTIDRLDIFPLEHRRLRYESGELALLYDALAKAIERSRPVTVYRRRPGCLIVIDPERSAEPCYEKLRNASPSLSGITPTGVRWMEATRLRLDYRMSRLWLLIEPKIWLDIPKDANEVDQSTKDFVRERTAARFNKAWNAMLEGWLDIIVGSTVDQITISSFGIADGIDGTFSISRGTAFAWTGE